MAAVTSLLSSELRGRGRCLEIGIGTGRIALPLAEAGVPMAGADLSRPMLAKLVEKAGGRPPFPLALADATALPFADHAFGAGLACHVLHLIPDWRAAVGELVRVIRSGGLLLVDRGGWQRLLREIEARFGEETGGRVQRPGLDHTDTSMAELDAHLTSLGARVRLLPPILERSPVVLSTYIDQLEQNVFSWTWSLDDETRVAAARAVREWATDRFGPLDDPRHLETAIRWRAYDVP
jgi:SAM-dependent methyltransferase